jgi:hypothetical protein
MRGTTGDPAPVEVIAEVFSDIAVDAGQAGRSGNRGKPISSGHSHAAPTDLQARHACGQLADSLGLRGRAQA